MVTTGPEKDGESGLDERALLGVDHPGGEPIGQLAGGGFVWIILGDVEPLSHHLRQRPETYSVAIRQAAPAMPEEVRGQAVDVLLELPSQSGLADAGSPHDTDEPRGCAIDGGVQELLD